MVKFQKKVGFVSLGCDKNRVDLERMISSVLDGGHLLETNTENADIIIINTCSFIAISRKESYDTINEFSELKKIGKLEKLIVTGCLNNMNYPDLHERFPYVDEFIALSENKNILTTINNLYNITSVDKFEFGARILTTNTYAYLKIADGCDNFCSYCKIPYIRGRFASEQLEDLIIEAENIVQSGIQEIILVAQDTTRYGSDFKDGTTLVTLIQKLSKIKDLKWIRLLYCYPENVTEELIQEIKNNPKVCKYIDLPLQHISNDILKAMNRKTTKEKVIELINKLRKNVPNIAIRTTFIVGFPGESEENFLELAQFVTDYKLNNVGFFTYSKEEGTHAYNLSDHVQEEVKNQRLNQLAALQYDVVQNNNEQLLETLHEVIVDEISDSVYCRTQFQAPDIDSIIQIPFTNDIKVGEFYNIKIKSYKDYDFKGEIV